jgi:hypothetical protein
MDIFVCMKRNFCFDWHWILEKPWHGVSWLKFFYVTSNVLVFVMLKLLNRWKYRHICNILSHVILHCSKPFQYFEDSIFMPGQIISQDHAALDFVMKWTLQNWKCYMKSFFWNVMILHCLWLISCRLILGNYLASQVFKTDRPLCAAMVISVPWNVFKGTESIERPVLNLMLNRHLAGGLRKNIQR